MSKEFCPVCKDLTPVGYKLAKVKDEEIVVPCCSRCAAPL